AGRSPRSTCARPHRRRARSTRGSRCRRAAAPSRRAAPSAPTRPAPRRTARPRRAGRRPARRCPAPPVRAATAPRPRPSRAGPAADAPQVLAPGLLGELLHEADACATAVGPGAAVMLAREGGAVDRYVPSLDAFVRAAEPDASADAAARPPAPGTGWGDALVECPVTVVDAGSLPEGPERAAALDVLDDTLSTLRGGLPSGTRVLVAGIADTPLTQQGLQVVVDWVADVPRVRWLTSQASRSTGFVQLTDLTATAAEAAGAL